ncbi:MAG: oxygen-independent coproporphyrinogen III oxidase [Candidatus Eisenbacteria bacterium]|nr:oxygen-independent coproporphyrinogen III oxidase [Candidatus Eisenbacteria bacterium]
MNQQGRGRRSIVNRHGIIKPAASEGTAPQNRADSSSATPLDRVTPELLSRYDRPGPRYTSYPTAVEFHEGFTESDYRERLAAADRRVEDGLSLYIHVPFCDARCRFCGCNVIATARKEVSDDYLDYLGREIDLLAENLPHRRKLLQYHWGGGTPTYLSPRQMEVLQKRVTDHFAIAPEAEVAIEVDPRTTTEEQLRTLRGLGFNRISLGVQDFTPEVQQAIGRIQTIEQTRRLVDDSRRLGFGSLNIDLIYGLPLQTVEAFEKTLAETIAMRPERVAVYSFAYLPRLRGNQRALDGNELPDRDTKFALFAAAIRAFLKAGYEQIGMDHFALPEDELARAAAQRTLYRNFMGYTVHRAPDMLGLGVSSIGLVEGAFAQNAKKLSSYYRALDQGRFPVEKGYVLTRDDRIRQRVILELMCNFYVGAAEIEALFRINFQETFQRELEELRAPGGPVEQGFARVSAKGVEVTPLGRLFIRNVAMIFDAYMREKRAGQPIFSRTV